MKIILSILLAFYTSTGFTQDIITLLTAEEIKAKVIEVTPDLIKYNLFGTEAPLYSIMKNTVFSIKYADGRVELIAKPPVPKQEAIEDTIEEEEEPEIAPVIPKPKIEYCYQGELDAYNFHRRGFGNFTLGFLFGIIGTLGVAATPAAPPPLTVPTSNDIKGNSEYISCYNAYAKKKNIQAAAGGTITGAVILFTAFLLSLQ